MLTWTRCADRVHGGGPRVQAARRLLAQTSGLPGSLPVSATVPQALPRPSPIRGQGHWLARASSPGKRSGASGSEGGHGEGSGSEREARPLKPARAGSRRGAGPPSQGSLAGAMHRASESLNLNAAGGREGAG
eukprot:2510250-Rhodomonas_salina.2